MLSIRPKGPHLSPEGRYKISQSLCEIAAEIQSQDAVVNTEEPMGIWFHLTKPNGVSVRIANFPSVGEGVDVISFETLLE
jgi:hypothetical protein